MSHRQYFTNERLDLTMNMNYVATVYTTETAARIVATADETVIVATKKANKDAGRAARELAICVPADLLAADELEGLPYHKLMQAVLRTQSEVVINQWADSHDVLPSEFPIELLTVEALSANYFAKSASTWIGKAELEGMWKASATWMRISGSEGFKTNKAYAAAASALTDLILKMSGKVSMIPLDKLDKIVAKLEDADLETPMGEFILRRAQQMREKHAEGAKDALDALDF